MGFSLPLSKIEIIWTEKLRLRHDKSGFSLGTKLKAITKQNKSRKRFPQRKDDSGLDQLTFADGLEVECERTCQ